MIEPNSVIVVRSSLNQEFYGRLSFIAACDGILFGVAPSQIIDDATQIEFSDGNKLKSLLDTTAATRITDGMLTAVPLNPLIEVSNPICAERFQLFSEFVGEGSVVGTNVWFGSNKGAKGKIVSASYKPDESSVPRAWSKERFIVAEVKDKKLSLDSVGALVCSMQGCAVGVVLGISAKRALLYRFDRFIFDNNLRPARDSDVRFHNRTAQQDMALSMSDQSLDPIIQQSNENLASFGLKRTGSIHRLRGQYEALLQSQGLYGSRDSEDATKSLALIRSFSNLLAVFARVDGDESLEVKRKDRSR